MPTKRPKPRSCHVRTGCITCKSRHVKCPEERPHCSRCVKAGFVCQGYSVPKPWLFEGKSSQSQAISSDHSSPILVVVRSTDPSPSPFLSALRNGNSDPFGALAIQVTPLTNFLIRHYSSEIVPQLYTIKARKWTSALIHDDAAISMTCLKDTAAGYSLLARLATIFSIETDSSNAALLPLVLRYQLQAQGALRKNLQALRDDPYPKDDVVLATILASYNLGYIDTVLKDDNAPMHLRAMIDLYIRYFSQLYGALGAGAMLFPLHAELHWACTSLLRPRVDIPKYIARVDNLERYQWTVPREILDCYIHPDVKDETIRKMIRVKREGQHVHRDLDGSCFATQQLTRVSISILSRNMGFQYKLLTTALDTMDELKSANLATLQGQDLNARAFVALAALHWGRFASQFPVSGKLLFDDAPVSLLKLRELLLQHTPIPDPVHTEAPETAYMCARLWALFVGAQSDQNRQDIFGLRKVCGPWFLDEFRLQAQVMRIRSWTDAASIFTQFLYNDKFKPHISELWEDVH